MLLAKSTTPDKLNLKGVCRVAATILLTAVITPVFAQDNSPYSRYGLGDITPPTNVISRSMGGVSAGYNDHLSVNYNNPASYAWFQSFIEAKSKKMSTGRVVLDVGMNIDNRTLREPGNNTVNSKFGATNTTFSHIYIGLPVNRNMGLTFGMRPLTRISYNMKKEGPLVDPVTNKLIDNVQTLSQGNGGSYLPSIGTGYKIRLDSAQFLSIGINVGYVFGKKDYSTRVAPFSDTVVYTPGNWQRLTTFGGFNFNGGLQYTFPLSKKIKATVGAFGTLQQTLNASQSTIRETYYFSADAGNIRIDSVYEDKDVKGKIIYPSSYTAGIYLQKAINYDSKNPEGGWSLGVDFTRSNWSDYRYYEQMDMVKNNWELRIGGELRPVPRAKSYFSNVAYRAGFFTGPDYINVGGKTLPQYGISAGIGLPLLGQIQQARNQLLMLNLGFEYIKRGNNSNVLKEDMFRISLGLSLSDLWFGKRKYD